MQFTTYCYNASVALNYILWKESEMELIGQSVKHKTLGAGTVENSDGKYLTVRFSVGVKTFVYPAAFREYLTASDPALAAEIEAAIQAWDAERERAEARRREEKRYLTRGVVIPGKKLEETSVSEPYGEDEI